MTLNNQSCDCRLVAGPDAYDHGLEEPAMDRAGEFYYLPYDPTREDEPTHIVIRRPDGVDGGAIPIKRGAGATGEAWGWDGNRQKPTLSPSIWWKDTHRPQWHGWLQAGRLNSC